MRSYILYCLCGLICLTSCGGGGGGSVGQNPPVPTSYTINVQQGNNQSAFPGAATAAAIILEVKSSASTFNVPLKVELPPDTSIFPQVSDSGPTGVVIFWVKVSQTPFTSGKIKISAPDGSYAEVKVSSGPRLKTSIGNASTLNAAVFGDGHVITFGKSPNTFANMDSNMALYAPDGTVEKPLNPGDMAFPIGEGFQEAHVIDGKIVVAGRKFDVWMLDQALNASLYMGQCRLRLMANFTLRAGPSPNPDGNAYYLALKNGLYHMTRMNSKCEFTDGGTIAITSPYGRVVRTGNSTWIVLNQDDDITASVVEFGFDGKILKRVTLPVLPDRALNPVPGYTLEERAPDGEYILLKDGFQGVLVLKPDLSVAREVQMHTSDGTPLQLISYRGVDENGNFYFGSEGMQVFETPLCKFDPEGSLLWWSGDTRTSVPFGIPPVVGYPITEDVYLTDGALDANGTAFYMRARGQVLKLEANGKSTSYPMTLLNLGINVGASAGPVRGPDGYFYTAHGGPYGSQGLQTVTLQAWDTAFNPIFTFTIPQIPAPVSSFAISPSGGFYLFDSSNGDLHIVDSSHAYVKSLNLGMSNSRPFASFTPDGDLVVSYTDLSQHSALGKFSPSGAKIWSKPDAGTSPVVVDQDGRIWVHRAEGVEVFDGSGNELGWAVTMNGSQASGPPGGGVALPMGVAGNDVWFYSGGRVYLTSAQ